MLVVLGLAFMGLLPCRSGWSRRGCSRARGGRGSSALLGAAFAVCAAPCIGGVLACVLVLAGDSETVVRGAVLLFVYSAGIAAAFVLAGLAFTRAMGAFRWLRDHYGVIQFVSGAILVALGLLLFFDRDWWLRVMVNRMLDARRAWARSSELRQARASSRSGSHLRRGAIDLREHGRDVDAAVRRARTATSRRRAFSSWRSQPIRRPRPAWYQATATWTRPWKKSRSPASADAPGELELLVRREVLAPPDELEPCGERCSSFTAMLRSRRGDDPAGRGRSLLPRQARRAAAGHQLVTTDSVEAPELVIADISRIEPEEVADAYPDIPILGFTNHTDTAGLRRAHEAGFDQVIAKSALVERAAHVIDELLSPVE